MFWSACLGNFFFIWDFFCKITAEEKSPTEIVFKFIFYENIAAYIQVKLFIYFYIILCVLKVHQEPRIFVGDGCITIDFAWVTVITLTCHTNNVAQIALDF